MVPKKVLEFLLLPSKRPLKNLALPKKLPGLRCSSLCNHEDEQDGINQGA